MLKLRENGATQLISLIVLKKKLLLPLNELDHIIINSKTWLDFKENTEKLRQNIFDEFDKIIKNEDKNSQQE